MKFTLSLDPCCNGRLSKDFYDMFVLYKNECLDPCCNGRLSKDLNFIKHGNKDGLDPCCNGRLSKVLIN